MTLTEYATYAREVGLLDESEKAFSKALNICRHVLGPTHEQVRFCRQVLLLMLKKFKQIHFFSP